MYAQKWSSSLSSGVCFNVPQAHIRLATACAVGRCLAIGLATRPPKCEQIVRKTCAVAAGCSIVASAHNTLAVACSLGRSISSSESLTCRNLDVRACTMPGTKSSGLKLMVADDHKTLLIACASMSASNACKLWRQRWNKAFSLSLTSAWPMKLGLCWAAVQMCAAAVVIAEMWIKFMGKLGLDSRRSMPSQKLVKPAPAWRPLVKPRAVCSCCLMNLVTCRGSLNLSRLIACRPRACKLAQLVEAQSRVCAHTGGGCATWQHQSQNFRDICQLCKVMANCLQGYGGHAPAAHFEQMRL